MHCVKTQACFFREEFGQLPNTAQEREREREREVTNKGRRERHNAVVCNYIRGERKTEIKKVRERERNRKKGEFF